MKISSKKHLNIALLFFILCPLVVEAQKEDILLSNSKKIGENRYSNIKGSPYLFEGWRKGKIITSEAEMIDNVLLNYNGYTKGFEVKKGNQFIELDEKWYVRVVIEDEKGGQPIIFQRYFFPPFSGKLSKQVYKGENITILQSFTIKIDKKVISDVGGRFALQRFISHEQYYLVRNRKPTPIKLKKKSILAELGNATELEQFIKKEKLKLNSEADLKKLVAFYEKKEK